MSVHPEITPPSNFHHFRDTTAFGNYLLVVVNRTTPATVSAPLIYFQLIAATVIGFFVFGDWPAESGTLLPGEVARARELTFRLRKLLESSVIEALPGANRALDVEAQARVRDFIRRINRERGTTILLTTHDLDEAEKLADRILVLAGGRIIAAGSADELSRRMSTEAEVPQTWECPECGQVAALRGEEELEDEDQPGSDASEA